MKHYPTRSNQVGLFVLDGTETIAEIKAAVSALREPIWGPTASLRFTEVKTMVSTKFKRTSFKAPKPGDDTVKHDSRVDKAVELCAKHGAEFWALGRNTGFVWGVQDGKYVEVWGSGIG